jgi:[NiFe] hydrogenase diaphorase moiety large subunit
VVDVLSTILARNLSDPTRLVQVLRDVMASEGWIAPATLTTIAAGLGLPCARVEGVATFYSFFATRPRGRFRVLFSDNITDVMAGSEELRARLLKAFDLKPGQVSADGLVSVGTTSCTGLCDQGPAMLVNDVAIARLTPQRVGMIASLIRAGTPVTEWPENLRKIDVHIERSGPLLSAPLAPGEALRAAAARGAEATLAELKASGLRGRGGAGFGTAAKWAACRAAPVGAGRVIVVNADEGEPGTFKDRVLLSERLDQVLEGLTVAGYVVGATQGFLYIRGEYASFLRPLVEAGLAARRAAGLLGASVGGIAGFDFDVDVHWGAGAYVCGEESALLESLEGKRGIPRSRPPYPTTHGYLGRPTVVNNVETLLAAAFVARDGAGFLRAHGTAASPGTKLLSIAGDVARPGIYEVPFGTTVGDALAMAGAADTAAAQVGGPSGTFLIRAEFARKIAFEDVPCAGAVMAFGPDRDLLAVVDNFARFFAHESCGFCTPCRVGTTLVAQMTGRLVSGHGTNRDLKDLGRLDTALRESSHCGLGATACNPTSQALAKLRPLIDRRLASREVVPSFDLDLALAPAREATARDDAHAHLEEEV